MKNYYEKCKKLVIYSLVLFSCIIVGYALANQALQITSTANITGKWDVEITSCGPGTFTGTAAEAATPTFNSTTATLSVNLNSPGDTASYPIKVKNKGNVKADLISITGITAADSDANEPKDVKFSFEDSSHTLLNPSALLQSGTESLITPKLLDVGNEQTYYVKVVWDSNATTMPTTTTKNATFST